MTGVRIRLHGFAAAVLLVVGISAGMGVASVAMIGCSGRTRVLKGERGERSKRVTKSKRPRPKVTVRPAAASKHPDHPHPHGLAPHGSSDHHHHNHPHPHLPGVGHHHPF